MDIEALIFFIFTVIFASLVGYFGLKYLHDNAPRKSKEEAWRDLKIGEKQKLVIES